MIRIAVIGLGYVGSVSAACLALRGHMVTGFDTSLDAVEAIRQGRAPVGEAGLDALVAQATTAGRLSATDNLRSALDAELSLICVGTPTRAGMPQYEELVGACRLVGEALDVTAPGHVVCVRSTMLPGTTATVVRPTLERSSGQLEGERLCCAVLPEFMREGSAVADQQRPSRVIIGAVHPRAARLLEELHASIGAPPAPRSPRPGG